MEPSGIVWAFLAGGFFVGIMVIPPTWVGGGRNWAGTNEDLTNPIERLFKKYFP
ncbi:MAG: hypothetical protein JNN11_02475 [Candidatus Doudnabacteria bacterium]|nr:hypothetical protein [Candidatus Doudnabacteria bacterium]